MFFVVGWRERKRGRIEMSLRSGGEREWRKKKATDEEKDEDRLKTRGKK